MGSGGRLWRQEAVGWEGAQGVGVCRDTTKAVGWEGGRSKDTAAVVNANSSYCNSWTTETWIVWRRGEGTARGPGGHTHWLLALVIRPLTTHSFRDGASLLFLT